MFFQLTTEIRVLIVLSSLLLWLVAPPVNGSEDCREEAAEWANMETGAITLTDEQYRKVLVPVRIADDKDEIAAGYQWICPQEAKRRAILFIFNRPYTGKFHMKNVFLPLHITYFNDQGIAIGSDKMQPESHGQEYVGVRYGLDVPFYFALESPVGGVLKQRAKIRRIELESREN